MKFAMENHSLPTILALLFLALGTSNAFSPTSRMIKIASTRRLSSATSTMLNASHKATLTPDTTWRLRFSLNGVPTKNGRKVGELFNVDVQFSEEDGYEPPQGDVTQIVPVSSKDGIKYLKVKKGRWQLSEDPEDRKDGLWIWGLFKEPLYPFMLLQIETEEYSLPGDEEDAIEPLKLYAQINHKRDKDTGEIELDAATLNIREIETIKADPFGAAKIDLYEEVKCGQMTLRPLIESNVEATL